MSNIVIKRVVASAGVFVSFLFLPWWVALLLGVLGTFYFSRYYEIIILGIFIDVIYGAPEPSFIPFTLFFTAISIALYTLIRITKTKLRH